MIEIAPSILAANVLNLGQDIQMVLDAGAAALHVDIMGVSHGVVGRASDDDQP